MTTIELLLLVLLFGLLVVIVLPVVAIFRANRASWELGQLRLRVASLDGKLAELELRLWDRVGEPATAGIETQDDPARTSAPVIPSPREVRPLTPIPPPQPPARALPTAGLPSAPPSKTNSSIIASSPPPRAQPKEAPPAFDWEGFTGARLFAWLGGLALFLGFAFLVKFSIDQGLLGPAVRLALGTFAGIALITSGLQIKRDRYRVTSQTLSAAGVAILHLVTFSAHQFYGFIGPATAFPLLAAITAGAFLLAVRFDSRYIALLGLLGGFLNPYLVSSGQDRPLTLFAYLAILNVGLIFIAVRKKWTFLVPLSALGTTLIQTGWVISYCLGEDTFPQKAFTATVIFVSFSLLYLGASLYATGKNLRSAWIDGSSGAMTILALGFAFLLLSFEQTGSRFGLIFTYVFVLNVILSILAVAVPRGWLWHVPGGLVTLVLLLTWTSRYLSTENLFWGLLSYLLFSLIHAGLPIAVKRWRDRDHPHWSLLGNLYPALMLIPVLISLQKTGLENLPLLWFSILLINLVGLVACFLLGTVWISTVFVVITLFLSWEVLWLLPDSSSLPAFVLILLFTTLGFVAAGLALDRQRALDRKIARSELFSMPVLAACLPYLLLLSAFQSLPMENPNAVFAGGFLLSMFLLVLDRWANAGPLSLVALGSVTLLQMSWLGTSYDPIRPISTILWCLTFLGLFVFYPFVTRRTSEDRRFPWWTSASAGPLHFAILAFVALDSLELELPGLIPGAFAVLYGLLLYQLARSRGIAEPLARARVALYAGVTLFFVSLIFPFQWEHQWLTIGWALEGLALIVLFRRIPHPGLKKWGVGLLLLAFVRLALNPDFLLSLRASQAHLLNSHLYIFGLVTGSLLLAARLWAPSGERFGKLVPSSLLNGLAGVLSFLLVNIETANLFSTGSRLRFEFGRSLGQDLTYSLAWGAFGLMLLLLGLRTGSRAARISSLALISVTTLKLFFYDLVSLNQLYRVGALLGLALILVLVSILYQRHLGIRSGSVRADRDAG